MCKGDVANEITKEFLNKRNRLGTLAGLAMIAAGTVALPFTGGMSAAGIAVGAGTASIASIIAKTGLKLGPVDISTGELAIICGTIIAVVAILKGARVTFKSDGSVIVEPIYKDCVKKIFKSF